MHRLRVQAESPTEVSSRSSLRCVKVALVPRPLNESRSSSLHLRCIITKHLLPGLACLNDVVSGVLRFVQLDLCRPTLRCHVFALKRGFGNLSKSYSSSSFPFGCSLQGLPQRIIHLTPSSASSSLTPTNFVSSFITSINLLFGLPRGLLPSSSNLINPPLMYSLSLFNTCLKLTCLYGLWCSFWGFGVCLSIARSNVWANLIEHPFLEDRLWIFFHLNSLSADLWPYNLSHIAR